MNIKVVEYIRENGRSPNKSWFEKLPPQAAAKVAAAQVRMELGNTCSIKWFDGIGEYLINWGPGLRIYQAQDSEKLIVLFGGGDKSSQSRDIKKAKKLLTEYKQRRTKT